MKRLLPLVVGLLCSAAHGQLYGQPFTVSGHVVNDETADVLPGVTVLIRGTLTGTTTDSEGAFSIDVDSAGAVLVFSFVGFRSQEVALSDGMAELDIHLVPTVLGLSELVVVGSRRLPRLVEDSAVPVDVLSQRDLASSASTDMDDLLQTHIPSYSVQRFGGDEAKLVRPATLRGLPTDNVMVLINGKRRHRSGSIALSGNSLNEGSHGPDLNMVPSIAIKRIEVLRDGASAQYGADAVAGVLNLRLRDAPHGVLVRMKGGQFVEGDGASALVAANFGLPLWRRGFFNLSLEYRDVEATVRSRQRADAQLLEERGYPVANPVQLWGEPQINNSVVGFVNAGIDIGQSRHAYVFGGLGRRTSEGGFFFRAPGTSTARGSVFRFGSGESAKRAVLDLDSMDDVNCQELKGVPSLDSSRADVDEFIRDYSGSCFLFNELFPGGFTPRFGADIFDMSMYTGLRGGNESDLQWDAAVGVATSLIEYFIYNTVNASYGPDTPTSFRPRDYLQRELTVSVDMSRPVDLDFLASPLGIAWGAQWRKEAFESLEGDPASYQPGAYASQGFSVGSNGYQGLHPQFASVWTRPNYAFYVDLEADVTERLLVGVAGRFEDFYEDFGMTLTGKAASLYEVTPRVSVRGTVSTGFRAPTPGQANLTVFRTTSFHPVLGLIEVGHVPSTHPIAVGLGGKQLSEETATSYSLGTVLKLQDDLSLTVDWFDISFRNRIAVTGNIPITEELARIIDDKNILGGVTNIREVRFYSNDFETRTHGVDLLLSWRHESKDGTGTTASLAWNWTATELVDFAPPTEINSFLDEPLSEPVTLSLLTPQRRAEVELLNPRRRAIMSARHERGPLHGLVRLSYYSGWQACRFALNSCDDLDAFFGGWLVDAEVGFAYRHGYRIAAGVQNLLDTVPLAHPEETARWGNLHPRSTPWDPNGTAWYVRLTADIH